MLVGWVSGEYAAGFTHPRVILGRGPLHSHSKRPRFSACQLTFARVRASGLAEIAQTLDQLNNIIKVRGFAHQTPTPPTPPRAAALHSHTAPHRPPRCLSADFRLPFRLGCNAGAWKQPGPPRWAVGGLPAKLTDIGWELAP